MCRIWTQYLSSASKLLESALLLCDDSATALCSRLHGAGKEDEIEGTHFLVGLLGAAALLIWGLRMVRTGILRAYGGSLRRRLGRSMSNRLAAFAAGLGITLLLQSSTATVLMAGSFASRGLVDTAAALAIMLGADVGTPLVAQLFSSLLGFLSPLLVLAGVVAFHASKASRPRDLGRVLLALHMISATAEPIRQSPMMTELLGALAGEPLLAALLAALLTVLSTSSLAVVLMVIAFAAGGLVGLPLALALILGANLGSAVTPLIATLTASSEERRVPLGNFIFRLSGVVVVLPLLAVVAPLISRLEPSAALEPRLVAPRAHHTGGDDGDLASLEIDHAQANPGGLRQGRPCAWATSSRACCATPSTSSATTIAGCCARSSSSTTRSTRCTRRSSSISPRSAARRSTRRTTSGRSTSSPSPPTSSMSATSSTRT